MSRLYAWKILEEGFFAVRINTRQNSLLSLYLCLLALISFTGNEIDHFISLDHLMPSFYLKQLRNVLVFLQK